MCPSYGAFRPIKIIKCSSHEGPDIARESMRKPDLLLPRMRLMAMKSMKGTWLGMAMVPRYSKDLKICFQ